MEDREPMKLAILCCCSAMSYTGPGSLSYEFRKGSMNGTVAIGYFKMESCPNWYQSLDWQDFMFEHIDKGFTVKKAYDRACAEYPQLADYVRFIGDPDLIINDDNTSTTKQIPHEKFNNNILEAICQIRIILKSISSKMIPNTI
jgi:hypothetical protein